MPLKNDYQRIADRSLDACDGALSVNIQEKAAFLAYHAFESTGCALSCHFGLPVGDRVTHTNKIKHFTNAAARIGLDRQVAALSITLSGLRNALLYPIENAKGGYDVPESRITVAQAVNLKKRVKGIVRVVQNSL